MKWQGDCTTTHTRCRPTAENASSTPTRILELYGSGHGQKFRLISSQVVSETTKYATLSHCWGSKPPDSTLQLLQSTERRLSEGDLVSKLPKTFKEAFIIAERLGIRYLWIDRLCIFQDSIEDWTAELAKMQNVYKNAFINISALGASNDEEGCFFSRDPSRTAPAIVRFRLAAEEDVKPMTFEQEREGWKTLFTREPLLKRGWVVQERLLATRVLHFGTQQVFWECNESRCCETHPFSVDGNPEYKLDKPTKGNPRLWKQLLGYEGDIENSGSYQQLFHEWETIIGYYFNCKLTVPEDKLPAISGLANDMKKRLSELAPGRHPYLAGLWEEVLPTALLWWVKGFATRASTHRSPSWSWACLDGPAELRMTSQSVWESTNISSVCSVETQPLPGNTDTGKISGGTIGLAGPVGHALILHGKLQGRDSLPNQYNILPVRESGSPRGGYLAIERGTNGLIIYDPTPTVIFDTPQDVTDKVFYILISASYIHRMVWMSYGLALTTKETGNDIKGHQRIGLVTIAFQTKAELEVFVKGSKRQQVRIV